MHQAGLQSALVLLAIFSAATAVADGPARLRVDTSLYPYLDRVKGDTDLSVAINARLPKRFSYFSYINISGAASSGGFRFVRSEQNLRWAPSEKLPIDVGYQAVFVESGDYDFSQLGVSWRVHDTPGFDDFLDRIDLLYRVTVYLKRFSSGNNNAWQMEHSFTMNFPGISERLYLGGFVDQTFNQDLPDSLPSAPIVAEIQGGVRVWKDFYLVAEYRVTEFRQGNEYNLAAGIEYKYAWR